MYSLLDGIVESMSNGGGGPNIVGENHDTSTINFVAGLTDPGEMIACGYLPEIRRRSGEQDAEYAARILPIVMALPQDQRDKIMGAAIARAGLDTSTGKVAVMVAGPVAWHGLGVNVAEAVSSEHAIKLAGQDWKVLKLPMRYVHDGKEHESKETFALVRADTGAQLGTVGSRYKIIQNAEGFEFLDGVLEQWGARYETAGSIHGGKKVWMMAKFPRQAFAVGTPEDKIEPYAVLTNPHDGSGKAYCFPLTNRIVCAQHLPHGERGGQER